MGIEQNTAKERGLAALASIRLTLAATGDLVEGETLPQSMARPAGHEDTGQWLGQSLPYPGLKEKQRPQGEERRKSLPGKTLVARKHSCKSIWCQQCFKKIYAPKQKERMARLDFRKTRMLTLTFDRDIVGQGEAAYLWYKENKPVGRFIQNLGRAGVSVEDWTANLEWHSDGTPHFHLLIQVSQAGRAGQIGEALIHQCWPYGRIHESFFKNEKSFMNFLGYFGKTGYLHKNKRYQIILPEWTKSESWRNKKINRFSSMKHSYADTEKHTEEERGTKETEPDEKSHGSTYAERISRCGTETDLWLIGPGPDDEFIRRLPIPYRELVNMLDGNYVEGIGFALSGEPWPLFQSLQAYAYGYSRRGGEGGGPSPSGENGPPPSSSEPDGEGPPPSPLPLNPISHVMGVRHETI